MAYAPPSIGPAGLSIPAYPDILAYLIAAYQAIYGVSVYLGPDSADYQFLSIVALKIADVFQAVQLAYNDRSPATAIGSGLDAILKMNGLARLSATYSTALVTLTGNGTPAVITNGVIRDVSGFLWNIPTSVTIPSGGTINVTAIAQQAGNITAQAADLQYIQTPTSGWVSVTNGAAAIAGLPFEADSSVRARQAISVALPSNTLLQGTIAQIAATAGVTRLNVVENYTSATDALGNPPHSITAVVEGGTDLDVATAIYLHKGIGADPNGTTTVTVTDPLSGFTQAISFERPTYVPIYVAMTVHGLTGYSSAVLVAIQAAIVVYLASLQIGSEVVMSEFYGAALTARSNPNIPTFSILSVLAGTSGGVASYTIATGGTGYTVGDVLTFVQSGGSGGTVTVLSVSGGVITGMGTPTAGAGYKIGTGLATTGGTGTGATLNITGIAPTGTSDIVLAFNAAASGSVANVIVTAV